VEAAAEALEHCVGLVLGEGGCEGEALAVLQAQAEAEGEAEAESEALVLALAQGVA
jgi:hypothetical protein